jgi:hypothetical protein
MGLTTKMGERSASLQLILKFSEVDNCGVFVDVLEQDPAVFEGMPRRVIWNEMLAESYVHDGILHHLASEREYIVEKKSIVELDLSSECTKDNAKTN